MGENFITKCELKIEPGEREKRRLSKVTIDNLVEKHLNSHSNSINMTVWRGSDSYINHCLVPDDWYLGHHHANIIVSQYITY